MPGSAAPGGTVARAVGGAARRAASWWRDSRPGRMLDRYATANGALLAGGIAYAALFSLVAILTIALTVFAAVLGGDQALDQAVEAQLSALFPGVLAAGGQGLVASNPRIAAGALSLTSVVAVVVLIWSALSAMSAVQTGVRAMFQLGPAPTDAAAALSDGGPARTGGAVALSGGGSARTGGESARSGGAAVRNDNAVMRRVWALAGFAVLGLGLLASAVVSVSAASAGEWAEHAWGTAEAAVVLRWAGYGASMVVDAACVALVFTVVARARPARRDLIIGSLAAAVAMGVLKHLGTKVVTRAASNALLASAATVVTLLAWVNLMARVLLYAAAWTAVPGRRHAAGTDSADGRRQAPS
ncbi:MAG: YihY/virulence factor BrkB family protein [Propionibacteriaceae bacterium]|nr:YihY/virulence factor BrkB family protein [Propionibacteriaceae bacterium]